MNVPKNNIVVGIVLFIVCTNQYCKAGTVVECPNLPITPYPPVQQINNQVTVQPTVPCQTMSLPNTCVQNTPLNPCQTTCRQSPSVSPCPNSPCPTIPTNPYPSVCSQTSCGQAPPANPCQNSPCPITPTNPCPSVCCQNQPVSPCPTPPVNPCQNSPCPITPTNPCPSVCCQNQPVFPCPTPPANQCQNSPCPITPTNPCPSVCCQNQPVSPCPTPPANPCQNSSCQTTPPSPTTTTITPTPTTIPPPTTTFPPPNLTLCPPGTILIGDMCHIIYCPPGAVMKNNRCVLIECPEGTVWTGHRCSMPEPIVHSFSFNHTITTYVNQTTPDIIINNTKNIVVNAPVTINEHASENVNCNNDYEECDKEDTTTTPTTETIQQNCCEVMTPRICEERNNRWHCYSRRSRRCGDFCIAPIIYLKPPRVYARPKHVIMPPMQRECESYGTCGSMTGGHDCSGCSMNNMSRCSYYCYRYACPSQKCNFFDQKEYCANNRFSMFGCQMIDGCYDDWCLNN